MEATGVPWLDAAMVWGGAFTVLAGVSAVVWRTMRGVAKTWRRVDQWLDDWYGEAGRPGVPGRPGVMERVGGIEGHVSGMDARLTRVEHELYPNTGESLRDAVDLTNRRLARLCPDEEDECAPPGPPDEPPSADT